MANDPELQKLVADHIASGMMMSLRIAAAKRDATPSQALKLQALLQRALSPTSKYAVDGDTSDVDQVLIDVMGADWQPDDLPLS